MTMDSNPKLFSQLRDVFPELEAHSYFELEPDVKDQVPKCRGSDPHLRKIEVWACNRFFDLGTTVGTRPRNRNDQGELS
jgi:hypothetical protein